MRVCIHADPARLRVTSGVPRHITEVVHRLLGDARLEASLFTNEREAGEAFATLGPRWSRAQRQTYSTSTHALSTRWALLNGPSFERLGGDADCLYLPADGYIPTDRARLAVTIHDVYKLERPVSGENLWLHLRDQMKYRLIYSRVAANADRILTVSKFSADRIMHFLGVPGKRITIVYNGVSSDFFGPNVETFRSVAARVRLPAQDYFVYVGGLKAKKNGCGIIGAWKRFEGRHPNCHLVVLGHHDPQLLRMAQRELRRALFPERLSDAEMAVLLRESRGLFFPSRYEGFGIPILEAFAAGTLVVASDIPPLREVGGNIPIYVDPFSAESMCVGLERCMSMGDERAQRIGQGVRVASSYTWDACAERVREALSAP